MKRCQNPVLPVLALLTYTVSEAGSSGLEQAGAVPGISGWWLSPWLAFMISQLLQGTMVLLQ